MTELRIERLELRGRLPGDEASARARGERVVATACGELLEQAFERAGVRGEGELCIRALEFAAPLPWNRGDFAMATAWSVRVAEAARAAVEAGGPGVVRYDSVAQALCDALDGAAQGDFGRAWAWRQLGLWPGGADVRGVLAALTARPEFSAAALREVAARGRLAPLLRALPGEAWTSVARAVLAATGASPALAVAAPAEIPSTAAEDLAARGSTGHDGPASRDNTSAESAAATWRTRAQAVVSTSPLCRAATGAAPFGLSSAARRALAVLALADCDPAALCSSRARHFVAALDDEMLARSGDARLRARRRTSEEPRAIDGDVHGSRLALDARDPGEQGADTRDSDAPTDAPAESTTRPRRREDAARRVLEATRTDVSTAGEPSATSTEGRVDDREGERAGEPDARTDPADGARAEEFALDDARVDADSEPPIARQRGRTRFGGLLFLLHVVDALGLLREWSEAGPLAAWPLRMALHRLALALLREAGHGDVANDDPAVLAFAGLRPLDPPPDEWQPRPSQRDVPAERASDAAEALAAIDDAARRVITALAERLPDDFGDGMPPGHSSPSWATRLARLIERRAEIVADPGWIELRLALDEIDTRVRRAGLDLDPGYVPWLGVVVKFRYV